MAQEAVSYLLAEKAREGKRVARLKWGDPFVFARGAEEALFLHEQGVPFEVVPGVRPQSATRMPACPSAIPAPATPSRSFERMKTTTAPCPMSIGRVSPASTAPSCATQAPSN